MTDIIPEWSPGGRERLRHRGQRADELSAPLLATRPLLKLIQVMQNLFGILFLKEEILET